MHQFGAYLSSCETGLLSANPFQTERHERVELFTRQDAHELETQEKVPRGVCLVGFTTHLDHEFLDIVEYDGLQEHERHLVHHHLQKRVKFIFALASIFEECKDRAPYTDQDTQKEQRNVDDNHYSILLPLSSVHG